MSAPQHAASVPARARALALVALLPCVLSAGRFADPAFAVDDAWISFRSARTLLETGVLTFDGSMPPVEGTTNLLWTLLSAAWIAPLPAIDPIVPARLLGAVLLLWTTWRCALLAGRLALRRGSEPEVAVAVTGLLVGGSGTLAFHALSGLETALWAALFVGAWELLDRAVTEGHGGPGLGLVLALLGMTRPEGVLLAGLIVGGLVLRPSTRRIGLAALVPVVLVFAAMEGFRLWTYGALVPNTFHAKPPDPAAGLRYLGSAVLFGTGGLAILPALGVSRRGTLAGVGVCVAILALGTVWSGGDWMAGARRLTLPLLWLCVATGVAAAQQPARRSWIGVVLAAWVVGNVVGAWIGWDHMRQAPMRATLVARAAARTPSIETVALADVGVFGWEFDRSVLDLIGLTDAHIASLPGAHGAKEWDEAYFRARSPELVLVRSESPVQDPLDAQPQVGTSERAVLLSILDRGGYRYHATFDLDREIGRYLLVFRRDDIALPDELWGPPPAKDLRQLLIELQARRSP
jgi:arabinofuranosyltransferase